jgi:ribosomal-protein-alanine N-acetyltransferase
MKYYGIAGASIKTREEAMGQINWCNSLFDSNSGRWIITEVDKDEYIGDIGFNNYSPEHHKAEIGYRLMKEYWNRGIITECIRTLVKYGFEKLNYNRIEALLDTRNRGCRRVLEKNQFVYEGTLRQYEFEHGEYIDMEIWSLLKNEYVKNN